MTNDAAQKRRERRRERRLRWIVGAGGVVFRLLARTWRMQQSNRDAWERVRASGQPVIFTAWHSDILALLWHHRGEGITTLISEHADGEIVARTALAMGWRTVRGSTTRGASRALLGMTREAQAGHALAFTPDGPRGPARRFAPGALVVAQRTGAPIVPVAVHASRAWRLSSWDRFCIPKPFARVLIAYGDPERVDADSPRAATDLAPHFEQRMLDNAARADG